jgi:hypothetical protein
MDVPGRLMTNTRIWSGNRDDLARVSVARTHKQHCDQH